MEYPINGIMEAAGCVMEYGSLIERPGFFCASRKDSNLPE